MTNSFLPPDWRERLNQHRNAPRPKWLRIASYVWIGMTAVSLIAVLALFILVNNKSFHGYLIRTLQAKASDSLGVPVTLENFALHFSDLSVDLDGLTVEGAKPYSNPPLLQVDHIQTGVRVVSIMHRSWYLDTLRIDRPIIRVFVDAHGVSNIPSVKSSGSSNTSVFELGIRHALVNQGEVYYNDKPSALSADLRELRFQSSFDPAPKRYEGTVAYSDGHLLYGAFRPVSHNFDAHFSADPNTFQLTEGTLTVGLSKASITATLRNYSSPQVQGHYEISLDGKQIAQTLKNASVPAGTILATGLVTYQQAATQSSLQALSIDGTISSKQLEVEEPSLRAVVSNFSGHYSLINGDARLKDFHAELLGGAVSAEGLLKSIGSNDSRGNLSATVRGVSVGDLARLSGSSAAMQQVAVSGKLNGDAKASWGKSFDDLVAQADATIKGDLAQRQTNGKRVHLQAVSNTANQAGIPIDSAVHATYEAQSGDLSLKSSYLRTPETTLTMNGTVSNRSSLNLQLDARDLREVEAIAGLFRPLVDGQTAQPLGLSGAASFQGNVRGTVSAPHLTGQLSASNLQFNGSTLKTLHTNVDVSPSMASLQQADLEFAPRGRIALSASAGLSKWAFTKSSPIHITMQASQLEIAELTKLTNQQIPVTGTLNAGLTLQGTQLNPVGSGNVSLSKLIAYDQPVQSLVLKFSGDGKNVHTDLAVHLPSGSIQGEATVQPGDRTYTGELHASGIELGKLQAIQSKDVDVKGAVALNATGQGSFDNPGLDATILIPTLVAQSQTIANLNLHLNVANHVGNATLTSSAVNTSIQAKARVDLTGDYLADASLDTQAIPFQPLLAVYAPDQAATVSGQTEIHATLHGPLKKKELIEAHLSIPVLKVGYNNTISLAAASPIRADYKNNVVTIQHSSIHGTDTDLEFQGSVPVTGNGPLSLLLHGKVNLQLAQLFDPDVRSSGELQFNIDSNGPASAADIGGQINIVDANFAEADLPVGLQHANGVLKVTKDRINIASFEGTVGGGKLTAQGGVAYRPGIQFDMGLAAKGIRILYPQGMRESVDANIRLAGTTDNASLGGSVNLSELSFTPAFDLSSFISQFSDTVASPPSQGFAQNLQLNLAVRSTNNVNLVSRTLSIGGTANLQVRGTAAEPVILGRVNLNDGDIILNGTRFVLNGGTIQFINPAQTEPVVNLALNTNIQQYSINLRFEGPVDQLRTEYNSDPALPSADIINLLAFGETTEASAQNQTPTNQAAESLVASQVSSQITSRVSKIAGISQLSISPVLAGSSSQGPPGAVITIQQRVTGNLFVNFSTNVASTQSQTIQGQYRISPKVSVSATRDPNGGFAFDTLIKKTW